MNNLDKQYQDLLQDILDNGVKKEDRTGTGTISVFGRQIRHKMSEGFPLLTTKKMPFKTIVTELLWFLRGDTNIKFLVDNNCHIWDGDAYKNYKLKAENSSTYSKMSEQEFIQWIKMDKAFAEEWGELGPIYGKQWRNWGGYEEVPSGWEHGVITHFKQVPKNDQVSQLIKDLKSNPDSRRLMVNAWNVGELDQMVLPPCHYGFQVYTRELSGKELSILLKENELKINSTPNINTAQLIMQNVNVFNSNYSDKDKKELCSLNNIPTRAISLMWNQRSVDTFLGLPFNIASYGLLLEIIAKEVNMVPDELIGNLGDVHLYSNHIEQAKEQIGRELTWEEKIQWVMKYTDVELENVYITEAAAALEATTRWPYPLPTLKIESEVKWKEGDCLPTYSVSDFSLENYQSHPTIKAPLSN